MLRASVAPSLLLSPFFVVWLNQLGIANRPAMASTKSKAVNVKKPIQKKPADKRISHNSVVRLPPELPEGTPNLKVCSDCSGWCTEVQAARLACALPVKPLFASDIEPYVRCLVKI